MYHITGLKKDIWRRTFNTWFKPVEMYWEYTNCLAVTGQSVERVPSFLLLCDYSAILGWPEVTNTNTTENQNEWVKDEEASLEQEMKVHEILHCTVTQKNNPRGQKVHLCTFFLRARRVKSTDSFIISSNTDVTLKLRRVHPAAQGITPNPETKSVLAALNHQKWLTTDTDIFRKHCVWSSSCATF